MRNNNDMQGLANSLKTEGKIIGSLLMAFKPQPKSKTAYLTIRPPLQFFAHVVYDRQYGDWVIIHSSLPLVNGGGQLLARRSTKDDALALARIHAKPTEEVLLHEDVVIGPYSPETNTSIWPA